MFLNPHYYVRGPIAWNKTDDDADDDDVSYFCVVILRPAIFVC